MVIVAGVGGVFLWMGRFDLTLALLVYILTFIVPVLAGLFVYTGRGRLIMFALAALAIPCSISILHGWSGQHSFEVMCQNAGGEVWWRNDVWWSEDGMCHTPTHTDERGGLFQTSIYRGPVTIVLDLLFIGICLLQLAHLVWLPIHILWQRRHQKRSESR